MSKKVFCSRMSETTIERIEQLANETGISKSNIPEFALEVLYTYFTTQQLKIEASAYKPIDGRKNKKPQV